jgi:hypothetical protein
LFEAGFHPYIKYGVLVIVSRNIIVFPMNCNELQKEQAGRGLRLGISEFHDSVSLRQSRAGRRFSCTNANPGSSVFRVNLYRVIEVYKS